MELPRKAHPLWSSLNDEAVHDYSEQPEKIAWLETVTAKIFAKTLPEAFVKIQDELSKLYHATEILGLSNLFDNGDCVTIFKICVTDWIVKAVKEDTSHLYIDSYLCCDAKFTDFRWFNELSIHRGIFKHLTSMRCSNKARLIMPSGIIAIEAVVANETVRFQLNREEARVAKCNIWENTQGSMITNWTGKHLNPKMDSELALLHFLEPQDLDIKALVSLIDVIRTASLKPRPEVPRKFSGSYGLSAGPYSCSADLSALPAMSLASFVPKATDITAMADIPFHASSSGSYLDTITANPAILSPLLLCCITEDRKILELGHKTVVLYTKALEAFFDSKATLMSLRLTAAQNLKACLPITEIPSFLLPCDNMLSVQTSSVPDFERKQFIRARKEIVSLAGNAEKRRISLKNLVRSLTSALNDASSWEAALGKNYELSKEIVEELRSDILCMAGLTVDEFFSKHLASATWTKGTFQPSPSPQLKRLTTILSSTHEKWACHDLLRLVLTEITGNADIAANAINEIDVESSERTRLKRSLNNSEDLPNLSQIAPTSRNLGSASCILQSPALRQPAKRLKMLKTQRACSTPMSKAKDPPKNASMGPSSSVTVLRSAQAAVARTTLQRRPGPSNDTNITIISDDGEAPVRAEQLLTSARRSTRASNGEVSPPDLTDLQINSAMDTVPSKNDSEVALHSRTRTKARKESISESAEV
ncbi:unnamed protein product [Oikopleura dioica]|uniref:Uncharacterized protein n=1 Tax=Oikopleura dioica TaxID=34765 RepID=E4Y5K9_OIKDI|nr:unnamed protein product [Oikopleura dioica]